MDAGQALTELKELSSQIDRAVVLDDADALLAATDADPALAQSLRDAALALVAAADELHATESGVSRAEVELGEGGLFVLREGGRTIAATTGPAPTSGLVVYDLRTCLHGIEAPKPKRKRVPRKPVEAMEGAEEATEETAE
jgi:hypothetical protein